MTASTLLNSAGAQRRQTILMIRRIRKGFPGHIHAFGIGGIVTLHLAAALGIDSLDSSGWRQRAARGLINLRGRGERQAVIRAYLSHLANGIDAGRLKPSPIAGAESLLDDLAGTLKLGIATANLLEAASLRLAACAIREPVKNCAFGANGGGAKRQILARAMADLALPPDRIIFIGDNLNDVEAGLANGVHFIGFSEDQAKCRYLADAGAKRVCNHHRDTLKHIRDALRL